MGDADCAINRGFGSYGIRNHYECLYDQARMERELKRYEYLKVSL